MLRLLPFEEEPDLANMAHFVCADCGWEGFIFFNSEDEFSTEMALSSAEEVHSREKPVCTALGFTLVQHTELP